MLLTDLIQLVRDEVPQAQKNFDDNRITRLASLHVQSLCRKQYQADQGYHNCWVNIFAEDWRETHTSIYEVALPGWVERINDARELQAGDYVDQRSPWATVIPEAQLGELLPIYQTGEYGYGWEFAGTDIIRLIGYAEPKSITLRVVKLPAPLIKFTVDLQHDEHNKLYLAKTLTLGSEARERGSYINSRFNVVDGPTLADSENSDAYSLGDFHVGVDSHQNVDADDGRRHEVQLSSPFSAGDGLKVGEVVETAPEIQGAHGRLLVLLIAADIHREQGNVKQMQMLATELNREWQMFTETITPRQTQGPFVAKPYTHNRVTSRQLDRTGYRRTRSY